MVVAIRDQPNGAIWRHNQAGDLATKDGKTIDQASLELIVKANTQKLGFTYTHHDVETEPENAQAVKYANENGFTVNLSANSLKHADDLADLEIGPVATVLHTDIDQNTFTPKGRKVVICPALIKEGTTCKTCGLCARQRNVIIGFPAHGKKANTIQ